MASNNNNVVINQVWEKDDFNLEVGIIDNQRSSLSYTYIVRGCDNEAEACKAAWDYAPETYDNPDLKGNKKTKGIPKARVSAEERCGENIWKVKVEYEHTQSSENSSDNVADDAEVRDDIANGHKEVTFEASAESDTIIYPYEQNLIWKADSAPPLPVEPIKIPIGWNGRFGSNAEYSGVEIQPSGTREEYKRLLKYSTVRDRKWRRRIIDCRNCMNNSKFKGWEKGEAMFLGASYQTPQKGVKYVDVTFSFSIRRNEKNPEIAGIQFDEIYGWNYPWVVYNDVANVADYSFGVRPKYIFVARVLKYANFDVLGL